METIKSPSFLNQIWTLTMILFKKYVGMLIGITFVFLTVLIAFLTTINFISVSGIGKYFIDILSIIFSSYTTLVFIRLILQVIDNEEDENDLSFSKANPNFAQILSLSVYSMLASLVFRGGITYFLGMDISGLNSGDQEAKVIDKIMNLEFPQWAGLVLFSVMYLYFSIRLIFLNFLIADEKMSFINAAIMSFKITNRKFLGLIVILLIVVLLNILGLITFLMGIFISYPFTMLYLAVAYRKMFSDYTEISIK